VKILITGGAGFIGSNMAAYLLNQGNEVVVIDDLSTGNTGNIGSMLNHPDFYFYNENLLSFPDLSEVLSDIERVYHFAAVVGMFHVIEHPIETLNVNINGTQRLYETLQKLGKKPLVLLASSSEIYGNQHRVLSETTPLIIEGSITSHAAYAISKLSQESIAMSYWQKHQIPSIVLRIFNTVGRNQNSRYGMVIPRLMNQAINNEDITVFGDGKQKRAFCNVHDSVNLIELLAANPESIGQIVNLGNDDEININSLAQLIKQISKSKSTIIHIPFEEVYGNNAMTITERRPDLSKLMSLTHYQYQWNIEKTIQDIMLYKTSME
jgi:UDP-glucose 4-epimerase